MRIKSRKPRYERFFGYRKHLWTVNEIERKLKRKNKEIFVSYYLIPLGIVAHARASDLFLHHKNEPSFMYNTIVREI